MKRIIRASFGERTIRVYQAFNASIALPALDAGRFAHPFKRDRMTWIKTSFNWMMYRSGCGTKPGQEYILGIDITREGFEWALANAVLSRYDQAIHGDHEHWRNALRAKPVRVQWDPERNRHLEPLSDRVAIQVGLSGIAVDHYLDEWIVAISDLTELARSFDPSNRSAGVNLPSDVECDYRPEVDLGHIGIQNWS